MDRIKKHPLTFGRIERKAMSENNNAELTKEYLHQRFSYFPVDIGRPLVYRAKAGRMQKGDPVGSINQVYYKVQLLGKTVTMHRVVWLYKNPSCYKYSEVPPLLDHTNKNRHDNRYENLRPASYRLNNFNVRTQGKGTSAFRGVSLSKNRNKWHAVLGASGNGRKKVFCGDFPPTDVGEIHAALAYDRAAFKEWGQDAISSLNFPENKANYMNLDEHKQLEFSFCDDSPAQQILDFSDVVLIR